MMTVTVTKIAVTHHYPLRTRPSECPKTGDEIEDPLTPKLAKSGLRDGSESEGQPSVLPRKGVLEAQRGGL